MLWLYLSLLAALIWGIISVLNKHVLSDELKDPILIGTIAGFVEFPILAIISIILSPVTTNLLIIIPSLATGIFYVLAITTAIVSMRKTEASRALALVGTYPIIVLIFATIFLGEVFTELKYAGIFLIFIGSVMISIRKSSKKVRAISGLFVALLASLLFALRDVILKYSVTDVNPWSTVFWIGIGGILTSLIFLTFHHPHIRKKSKAVKGIEHLLISNLLAAVAFVLMTLAMNIGYASLVSAVIAFYLVFLFIIALILSKIKPDYIKEEMKGSTMIIKAISIILILIGIVLIV